MTFRFYVGTNEKAINLKDKNDPAAHYARCLKNTLQNLKKSTSDQDRVLALKKFEEEIQKLPPTAKMFNALKPQFYQLMKSRILPSNQYIIGLLIAMPIPGKGYLEYTESSS